MALKKTGSVYTLTYSEMHGVDFTPDCDEHCFAYLENMYRDREGGGEGIETFPGFRKTAAFDAPIYAIHPHPTEKEALLIHAGNGLYNYPIADRDTGNAPVRCTATGVELARRESRSALAGGCLWLADGARYTCLDRDGLRAVEAAAYRPTIYADGEALEQPNLLTPLAYESFGLFDLDAYAYHTEAGFTYKLLPDGRCYIEHYTGNDQLVVLPVEASIGGRRYAVTGVAGGAFAGNRRITTLIVPIEIRELAPAAFVEMYLLNTVVLAGGVTHLPDSCFSDCNRLETLYIGVGLESLSTSALRNTSLTAVHFAGDATEFLRIEGHDMLRGTGESSPMHYLSAYRYRHCYFPLHGAVTSVTDYALDGAAPDPALHITIVSDTSGNRISGIRINAEDATQLYGKTLTVGVHLADGFSSTLQGEHPDFSDSGRAAINGCRLICRYDGRLFLSGNPALPGRVFYTGRRRDGQADPGYIGLYQHFVDGDGKSEVRALLSTATGLLVMTEDSLQGPTIFRHEGVDTESDVLPRIYPVTEALSDVGAVGDAILFHDDPLFLSKRGLEAVEPVTLSLAQERRLAHRSGRVDPLLQCEDLAACRLFRFGTYLGISAPSGHIYLADGYERARGNRSTGYDWYYLSDIGSYKNQYDRYRYVTHEIPAPLIGESVYQRLTGTYLPIVLSDTPGYTDDYNYVLNATVNDFPFTFLKIDGRAVLVDTDGEKMGGELQPATAFAECGGLLFFGTIDGGLFILNTDKRAPDGSIPRQWYSFNGRAYRSACATRSEDGSLPHLQKSTLRGEGAIRLQAMTGSRVEVLEAIDGRAPCAIDTLYGGRLDFCETDFATTEYGTGRTVTLRLREPAGRWVERAIHLVSTEYMRPFGVISIAYRYRVAGRI